jgi:hypothetical protein
LARTLANSAGLVYRCLLDEEDARASDAQVRALHDNGTWQPGVSLDADPGFSELLSRIEARHVAALDRRTPTVTTMAYVPAGMYSNSDLVRLSPLAVARRIADAQRDVLGVLHAVSEQRWILPGRLADMLSLVAQRVDRVESLLNTVDQDHREEASQAIHQLRNIGVIVTHAGC